MCIYIITALISFFSFSSTLFTQTNNKNIYFRLSEKFNNAKVYKDYIPESVMVDTQSLLNKLENNSSLDDNRLFETIVNSRIELLDIYILNSEKKLELKSIKDQIQKEEEAYRELEELNKKLEQELENAG